MGENNMTNMHVSVKDANDPLRVLLIEDNKGDAILISKAIESAIPGKFILKHVETIESAQQLLSEEEFDVALLDRTLPDSVEFSGLHTIQSMAPKLPIIYLTGNRDEKISFEAIEQGAQDYLFKDVFDGHIILRAMQFAILRKQFEGMLIMRANFDMLTGLVNRMHFEQRLDLAIAKSKRSKAPLSVLFIDLNKFKQVNDTMGHAAGDELLKIIGTRIKDSLRPYDTAARFGGDEFAILLEDINSEAESKIVSEKIQKVIAQPMNILGKEIVVGSSVGISHYVPGETDGLTGERLITLADEAMYKMKRAS